MCGIVGIYDQMDASTLAYLCFYALQHRGQEGAGIISFAMDFPCSKELIANRKNLEEIRKHLNVDSVKYLSVSGLLKSMYHSRENFCTACFTNEYSEMIDDK